jgi:hypothetical protein
MKVVYKYPIPEGKNTLTLPKGAKVVHVGTQHHVPMLWIEHQEPFEGQETEVVAYQTFGTGHGIPDFAGFLGTIFEGPFVWHFYQVAPWVEVP